MTGVRKRSTNERTLSVEGDTPESAAAPSCGRAVADLTRKLIKLGGELVGAVHRITLGPLQHRAISDALDDPSGESRVSCHPDEAKGRGTRRRQRQTSTSIRGKEHLGFDFRLEHISGVEVLRVLDVGLGREERKGVCVCTCVEVDNKEQMNNRGVKELLRHDNQECRQ